LGTLTTIGLVVGTAELSWKIGTGIRTKILKVGLPDPPQPKASPASGTLAFQNAGYTSSFNNTPLPADGWLLRWWYGSSQWSAVNLSHGWGHACAYLTSPPQDFRVLPGYATVGWCENPPVPVESYWLTENELEAVAPVQDYVDQPFDKQTFNWDGKPASKTELEARTRAALESGDYPMLDIWYAHLLEPLNYPDPTTTEEQNHRCDVSAPSYKNRGGNAPPTPICRWHLRRSLHPRDRAALLALRTHSWRSGPIPPLRKHHLGRRLHRSVARLGVASYSGEARVESK